MEMIITQLKEKCLCVVERVQREKLHVVIWRHGRSAAQFVPIDEIAGNGRLFSRAARKTKVSGDLLSA